MQNIDRVIQQICAHLPVTSEETAEVAEMLQNLDPMAQKYGISLAEERLVMIGAHMVAFIRRIQKEEWLPALDEGMMDQLDTGCVRLSREFLESCLDLEARKLDDAEIFFLAAHFEAAMQLA